jgi:cytochrome c
MFRLIELFRLRSCSALGIAICFIGIANAQEKFPGVGRTATPAEIKAWDIDVRPDFKGLPAGSGSVAKGQQVWETKCESCHGAFGESNEVFTPIVGGTTKEDMKTGRVAALTRSDFPQRTTLMKLSQISSLWDYINRAMPWNAPKSLSVEEVYAVTAYVLNLGDIVPADFVLSDKNIADVQAKLPNRNGKVKFDALWNIGGKGDVTNVACMSDCKPEANISSALPDYARNQHGNLAEQNRVIGGVRGAQTAGAPKPTPAAPGTGAGAQPLRVEVDAAKLASQRGCMACHLVNQRAIGPSYAEIAKKYQGVTGATGKLMAKVRAGGAGSWGAIPMPAQANLSDAELKTLVQWVLSTGN